jgi:endonuclease YncB( thermonuclease family)
VLIMLAGGVAIDQFAGGNDWRRFDRRSFNVLSIPDANDIVIDGPVTVHLIGIDGPYDQSLEYVKARLKDRPVTLKLETTQTRDADGKLLAYVYLADNDCLNMAMIRDGKAFADRRVKHTYASQYEQAETEARKKARGIWKGLTDDQMPAWRREWLEQLRKERAATTRRS